MLVEIKDERSNLTYLQNEKFKQLYQDYNCNHNQDEFIFFEALKIYSNTDDDELKVRILELIKKLRY